MPDTLKHASDYNDAFINAIKEELGDETLERIDWVKVEEVIESIGECRCSFMGQDIGWVRFGVGVPIVGEQLPMHSTFHGDRWVKVLVEPWTKVWTYSDAPIESTDGYPYHDTGGAGLFAWAGRQYCIDFGNGFAVVADGDSDLGTPLDLLTPPYNTVDMLTSPVLYPVIHALIQRNDGLIVWQRGVESDPPIRPELPGGSVLLGYVYLEPQLGAPSAVSGILPEVIAGSGGGPIYSPRAFVMTDTRREFDIFVAKSFNQNGARFTDVMNTPSRGDALFINPPTIFGDKRDGAGVALAGITYDLATSSLCGRGSGDCAFEVLTNWGFTGQNRLFSPAPAGVVAGDQVMAYIARAKKDGNEALVGTTYIGRVLEVTGGACIMERTSPPEVMSGITNYYAYIIRVPQYSTLEMQTNSRVFITPVDAGGPGALAIKCYSLEGSGRFDMSGGGCIGGTAGYQCGPPEGRTWEGQGLRDKPAADIGNGIGMYGGGYGAQVEFCDPYNNTQGAGGAGGGAGAGMVGFNGDGGAFPNGLFTYTSTGDPGPGGDYIGGLGLSTTQHETAGKMCIGSGGGAGFASNGNGGTHGGTDKGGQGGGCVAIFCYQGSPLVDCNGARTFRSSSPIVWGSGGGGGGSIYVVSVIAENPSLAAVGETGGIMWHDAFHDDGKGGNGGNGRIHLFRTTLLSGSFSPTRTETTPVVQTTDGTWLSEPVDTGRPGRVKKLSANFALDGSDNIPPKFYIEGSNNVEFTDGNVFYPEAGDYWYQGSPTYPIVSGVELDISSIAVDYRRYWRLFCLMDTGTTNYGDTPIVYDILISGVS